jgi:CheY-like chemotaxis protein
VCFGGCFHGVVLMADIKEKLAPEEDETGLAPVDRARILIVDDEKSIRNIFTHVLAYHLPHCRVDAVVNGAEAVAAFMDVHYGVFLMDINMPVMDGVTAFEQIMQMCRERKLQKPSFVFCTGYEPPSGLRLKIGSDPAHCILRKPVRNDDLIAALKSRIEHPEKAK